MTVTSDLDALLAAVLASPEDELPRLVYADCLEERAGPGDVARAEFIRLPFRENEFCAIGSMAWMRYRRQQLLVTKPFQRMLIDRTRAWVQIRHGFVSAVMCPLAAWIDCGAAIVCSHPIERVRITDREPHSGRFFGFFWIEDSDWATISVPDRVPPALWQTEHLSEFVPNQAKSFNSRDAALDALSTAALTWARGGGKPG